MGIRQIVSMKERSSSMAVRFWGVAVVGGEKEEEDEADEGEEEG